MSKDAKELISSLLTVNPEKRLTSSDSVKNKWILGDATVLASNDLGINLAEFKKFNAKRKLKAAVKAVMATQKLTSLGDDFKKNL